MQRQLDLHLLDPELAKVLDLEQVRPFLPAGYGSALPLPARSCGKNRSLPRCRPEKSSPKRRGRGERPRPRCWCRALPMWCWCLTTTPEILDYKTDKSRNATYYIESYAAQLRLYRRAFALRLPVPVTKLTIYSFAMQDEIDIPLEYAAFGIGDKLLGR